MHCMCKVVLHHPGHCWCWQWPSGSNGLAQCGGLWHRLLGHWTLCHSGWLHCLCTARHGHCQWGLHWHPLVVALWHLAPPPPLAKVACQLANMLCCHGHWNEPTHNPLVALTVQQHPSSSMSSSMATCNGMSPLSLLPNASNWQMQPLANASQCPMQPLANATICPMHPYLHAPIGQCIPMSNACTSQCNSVHCNYLAMRHT